MPGARIRSPKQSQSAAKRDWYPYYGGYRSAFVEDVLNEYAIAEDVVLDPWNGSGTTTSTAARLGLPSIGYDINPVLAVLAKARLVPAGAADTIQALCQEVLQGASLDSSSQAKSDSLGAWFRNPALGHLRAIARAVESATWDSAPSDREPEGSWAGGMPLLTAFFYTALFSSVRDFLVPFKASNPAWLRYPPTLLIGSVHRWKV